jgi:hypothetical protein
MALGAAEVAEQARGGAHGAAGEIAGMAVGGGRLAGGVGRRRIGRGDRRAMGVGGGVRRRARRSARWRLTSARRQSAGRRARHRAHRRARGLACRIARLPCRGLAGDAHRLLQHAGALAHQGAERAAHQRGRAGAGAGADHLVEAAADLMVHIGADGELVLLAVGMKARGVDGMHLVVEHLARHVLLGVQEEVLLALLVLHAHLVEAGALMGLAADRHFGLVMGELIGRHMVGVIGAPDDEGLIRIALGEGDQHALADARNGDMAPLAAAPVLRDADPAG